ncbi:MAG: hypothetical protein GQ564_15115 [Bacteroidales bacterium]|nr:hypothetical protein [Bacteroidales bacterium]
MKKYFLTPVIIAMFTTLAFSQSIAQTDSLSEQAKKQNIFRKHSIGGSFFMVLNLFPESADYFQLNYGYQLTRKDKIMLEAISWTVYEPIGTYGDSDELYPGKIRSYGVGLGYQRLLWKDLFTTVEPSFLLQQYFDEDDKKIQKGFQLYLQVILGYRFDFFKKRFFVEPAYALKYWPVDTNYPDEFAAIEKGTPKYIFEPHLNFGFRF